VDLGLTNQVFLVTGASRGIGRQIALDAASEGARVMLSGRNQSKLNEVARQIRAGGGQASILALDLTAPHAATTLVSAAMETFGRLDVLVNNASLDTGAAGPMTGLGDDTALLGRWQGKVVPAVRCSLAAVAPMTAAGGGRIVMIGGNSARTVAGQPGGVAASAASGLGNAALANFAKHLSADVAHVGILVNIVQPGFVRTERHSERIRRRAEQRGLDLQAADRSFENDTPVGRMVTPGDVASVVLFLASVHASAITGQAIAVDGGATTAITY
jgi:3-oxoacyl-[acyl-carrier protein] reductase